MDFNEQTQPQQDDSARHLNDMAAVGENMVGWLKFLGVVNIIMGVFVALSIVGILVAWLPIWLGVLLFQAGNQITEARVSRNYFHLVEMMRKFKMYFMIQGILLLISLIFAVIGFLSFGAAIIGAFGNGDFNTY
jgi:hypothetical protein